MHLVIYSLDAGDWTPKYAYFQQLWEDFQQLVKAWYMRMLELLAILQHIARDVTKDLLVIKHYGNINRCFLG